MPIIHSRIVKLTAVPLLLGMEVQCTQEGTEKPEFCRGYLAKFLSKDQIGGLKIILTDSMGDKTVLLANPDGTMSIEKT